MSVGDFLERAERRREDDELRFDVLDPDKCMLCDAHGPDKRSLFIDCGYAVHEVIDEIIDIRNVGLERGKAYYLLICKSCRGRLLAHLEQWANECRSLRGLPKDHDGELELLDSERNIPVRVHGAIKMLTQAEWDELYPGREPFTFATPEDDEH